VDIVPAAARISEHPHCSGALLRQCARIGGRTGNAASHIALGHAYTSCLRDVDKLPPEELAAKGANDSLIHVDWMMGSGHLDIDGVNASGTAEPLMRQGEWV